jgi:hypothetical protein
MKKLISIFLACMAALPALALDGVPAGPLQWYVNPSTGAIVGYRNQVTNHDTTTFGAIGFGALTATTGDFSSTLASTGNFAVNTNKFNVTASSGATAAASTMTATAFIPSAATVPTNGLFLSAANTLGFATNSTERWVINASGALNCATDGGCDIGSGAADPRDISITRNLTLRTATTVASNAACTAGTLYWDASYIYVCTATGVVKRAALTGGY